MRGMFGRGRSEEGWVDGAFFFGVFVRESRDGVHSPWYHSRYDKARWLVTGISEVLSNIFKSYRSVCSVCYLNSVSKVGFI